MDNEELENKLSVVVICYDPYNDAIDLSPYFFNRFWSDCPFNTIYVTGNIKNVNNHKTLTTNGDLSYYKRLLTALKNTDSDYLLLMLDDYLLDKKINNELILSNLQYCLKNDIDFCELYTMFLKPKGKRIDKNFLIPSYKLKYRINLQPSLFKREYLYKVLETNPKTAWDFELAVMDEKLKTANAVFALNKSFSITNYIDKGKVTRKARRLLKKHNKWNNQRAVVSIYSTIKKWILLRIGRIMPQKIKNLFKKEKIYGVK